MRRPLTTYRLQFNRTFGFAEAAGILEYLTELGISDIYASPVFKAARGSLHGYDVVDHCAINPELGGPELFEHLLEDCRRAGLGWMQDIVPNHSAFDSENVRLMDICENGPDSEFYNFFDIDWEHPYPTIRGKLLAPFLGKFYVNALEQGDVKLHYTQNGFTIDYFDLALPLKIETYTTVLIHGIKKLKTALGEAHSDYLKLLGVVYILKSLPQADQRKDRHEQIVFIKKMLWELYANCPEFHDFIGETLQAFNGSPNKPEAYALLDSLLSQQIFRLAFWKVGTEEINYRRFFSLNNLICLRVENPDVFDMVHELMLPLIKEQKITGLRIDHIDGLWDPSKYLDRLRFKAGPVYTVVEKILAGQEQLPQHWPVQGTTGYDFMNMAGAVMADPRNGERFEKIYEAFIRMPADFKSITREKKKLVISSLMTADIDNLALFIKQISGQDRYGKDITLHGLRRALVEVMAMFPVYRTYISYQHSTPADKAIISQALSLARRENPDLVHEFDFIERFLLLQFGDALPQHDRNEWVRFVMRFQQFTGPLMAKGIEDTVMYLYNRLISRNDVGSDPSVFAVTVRQFHAFNLQRAQHWPATMNTTSTHDSKRGEDARARIAVLSELPQQWLKAVRSWRELNGRFRPVIGGRQVPDKNDEYFLYQTLIGAYPDAAEQGFSARLTQYMVKAVREAKIHTQWIKPAVEYENGFTEFIEKILTDSPQNAFLPDFLAFRKIAVWHGVFNSLSQLLLKIASPGLPDFYQGTELWDLSMVDPDNRRPIVFELRKAELAILLRRAHENPAVLVKDLLAAVPDPLIKMFTMIRALKMRAELKEVFEAGDYVPVRVVGAHARNLIAFARIRQAQWALVLAPRLTTGIAACGQLPLGQVWKDTQIELPRKNFPEAFTDAFTGRTVAAAPRMHAGDILALFPVGLLSGERCRG